VHQRIHRTGSCDNVDARSIEARKRSRFEAFAAKASFNERSHDDGGLATRIGLETFGGNERSNRGHRIAFTHDADEWDGRRSVVRMDRIVSRSTTRERCRDCGGEQDASH
jgi:hypothetical protein